ncbi:MAG TPA: HNH endonuclease signature motif containing protein [Candidatus Angelobacter sp.]|nr:HNH endonuclease signature motif containing protein [Candidatus Angelobacter sp.]
MKRILVIASSLALVAATHAQSVRLPNPKLTPGATTDATATALCSKSFHTGSVRNVPESEKNAVYKEYGISNHKGYCAGAEGCEIDHLISLELGGSNDIKNLWPQPYGQHPGAHEKDWLENALHRLVCARKISLEKAQQMIARDWYSAYRQICIEFPPANSSGSTPCRAHGTREAKK